MSPIFIRPVREQLEHDRLIRHLQGQYKKKTNEVAINPGEDLGTSVKLGAITFFPDILVSEAGRLTGLVEVETGESVNNLEVMAQWVHFSKARVPFHLYVPVQFYDTAKRLADARQLRITEIWTYRGLLDGFDLVRMHHDPAAGAPKAGVLGVKVIGPAPKPVIVEAPVEAPPPPPPAPPVVTKPVALKGKVVPPPVVTPVPKPPVVAAPKVVAKPVKVAAPVKPAKAATPAKAVKPAPPVKAAKVTKPAKAAKPVRPAKATKAKPKPKPKAAKAVKSAKAAKKSTPARRK